jgi:hypothetical protein
VKANAPLSQITFFNQHDPRSSCCVASPGGLNVLGINGKNRSAFNRGISRSVPLRNEVISGRIQSGKLIGGETTRRSE